MAVLFLRQKKHLRKQVLFIIFAQEGFEPM